MKFVPYILILIALYGGYNFFKNEKKNDSKKVKVETIHEVIPKKPKRLNTNQNVAPRSFPNQNAGIVPPQQVLQPINDSNYNQNNNNNNDDYHEPDNYPSEEYNSNPPEVSEPNYQQNEVNDAPVEDYVPEENVNAQPSFENQPSPQFNPHTPQFNPDNQSFENNN